MDIILYSLKTLLPILLPIGLGYFIRSQKWLDAHSFEQMNGMIFKTLLPLLIFMNIYHSSALVKLPWRELGFAIIMVLIIFFLSWLTTDQVVKDRTQRGMIIQALFRSNFVLYGVPLTAMLLDGKTSGLTEILIAIIIPLYNLLAVFILSFYGEQEFNLLEVFKRIVRNPLIIACVLAIFVKAMHIEIPELFLPALNSLSKTATPLALLVLGGQFYFSSGKKFLRYLIPTVLFRLFIIPLVTLTLAVLLGFTSEAMIAFLALFASPAAVSSFTMAQQMCEDAELSAQLLVYTSVFSALSLFIFISIGRALALI